MDSFKHEIYNLPAYSAGVSRTSQPYLFVVSAYPKKAPVREAHSKRSSHPIIVAAMQVSKVQSVQSTHVAMGYVNPLKDSHRVINTIRLEDPEIDKNRHPMNVLRARSRPKARE